MTADEWMPIPGYTARYRVSRGGRVYDTQREVEVAQWDHEGYRRVWLVADDGATRSPRVHRLVIEAFLGPGDARSEVRHLNGVRSDNRLENLAYGSHGENMRDRVRHGMDPNASKTQCAKGHPFTEENTYHRKDRPQRQCRACHRERERNRQRASKTRRGADR